MQKDPIRFGGGDENLYRYVGNDPVRSVDPSGLQKADRAKTAEAIHKLLLAYHEQTTFKDIRYERNRLRRLKREAFYRYLEQENIRYNRGADRFRNEINPFTKRKSCGGQ
jgi:uncharacterized protein RhaS with RHS repeats